MSFELIELSDCIDLLYIWQDSGLYILLENQ